MSEKRFGYGETDLFEWVEDNGKMISTKECVNKLNEFEEENEQLKKAEKINMEYAEQIVEENKKLRIQKNDLRIENERLRSLHIDIIETIVKEPFYQEIFKEFLLESNIENLSELMTDE